MKTPYRSTSLKLLVFALASALLLSACGAGAKPPGTVREQPRPLPVDRQPLSTAPRPAQDQSGAIAAASPTESPRSEAAQAYAPAPPGTTANEAARSAPPPNRGNGGPPPAAPKAIAASGDRMPIEPTPVGEAERPEDTTFKDYGVNPPIDPLSDRFSTFALDVDTASYAVARKYVNEGILPPYEAIRAEEFINYFVQDYAPPSEGFAIYADGAPSPFHRDGSQLVRFGIQGYRVPEAQRQPASLTFVIDVSGSMDRENRLGLVKHSLQLLVDRLTREDSVSIVVYGSSARVVLYPTNGARRDEILNAIYSLQAEGRTNMEAGLQLGYKMASDSFIPGGINRVVLLSDGVANVGNTEPGSLINAAKGQAPDDVTLTTIGFGMENYNDVIMEQLANKGNGFYAYIDTIDEARTMFLDRLTNSLQGIAKDAKVQVEFNPDVVASYRLIGYENRAVADQDFRNNAVDAGELNSGHNATALYQIQLRPGARGRIATVFLRWQDVSTRDIRELNGEFNTWDLAANFEAASARFQMNAVVAEYAEILRRSPYSSTSLRDLSPWGDYIASRLPGDSDVVELAQLIRMAGRL